MKTSKLLSLATGLLLLSATAFATKTTTGNQSKDTTWNFASLDYIEWDYTSDPLQEVLEMDAIPMIYMPEFMNIDNLKEEYIDPLQEVLKMEAIPTILVNATEVDLFSQTDILDTLEEEYINPLQEVMEMEAIPTIYQPTKTELGIY